MRTLLILSICLIPLLALSDELPRDVADVLKKLESFESEELAKANRAIAEKRAEVAEFLETALKRETKSGNLDGAIALKRKIAELKKPLKVSPAKADASPATSKKGDDEFEDWLQTVEFHDGDGRWEITRTEVIQHRKTGTPKRFARKTNGRDGKVSFEAVNTVFTFEFDKTKTSGVRRSEKFPDFPFTVKPK